MKTIKKHSNHRPFGEMLNEINNTLSITNYKLALLTDRVEEVDERLEGIEKAVERLESKP